MEYVPPPAYDMSFDNIVPSSPTGGAPTSPLKSPTGGNHRGNRSAIDYSKFKTKVCRNYLLGIPCPFEDRCAFAHGDVQSQPQGHREGPPTSTASNNDSCSDHGERGMPPPPPPPAPLGGSCALPPSYDDFITSGTESPVESRPATPPYPARYRYEPYSMAGIVYEN